MSSEFPIIQLPREYVTLESQLLVPELADKGKMLRLESLKTNPEAFGSTYEREIALEDDHWRNRLKFPNSQTVVAVDLRNHLNLHPNTTATDDLEILRVAPWVGTMAANGPRVFDGVFPDVSDSTWKLYHSTTDGITSSSFSEEPKTLLYGVYATYVQPGFRGKRIGKRLMEALMKACAKDFSEQKLKLPNSKAVCVVFVVKSNDGAKALYEGTGFKVMNEELHTSPYGWTGVTIAYRKDIGNEQ